MKKILAVLVAMFPAAAFAADVWVETPGVEPEAPATTWTGFGVGLYAGWGNLNTDIAVPGDDCNLRVKRCFPGAYLDGLGHDGYVLGGLVGYDQQFGRIVAGIQGDYSFTDLSASGGIPGIAGFNAEMDWQTSVVGRVGILPHDDWLISVLGGWTWAGYDINAFAGDDSVAFSDNFDGWTLGMSIDGRITDTVYARLEYRHTDFGSSTMGTEYVSFDPTSDVATLSLVYKFNPFGR